MVKINGQDVDWTPFPEGWFLTDVKYHILRQDKETQATFMLLLIPAGGAYEGRHSHPQASHMGFTLKGNAMFGDREYIRGEDNYNFGFHPKGEVHGPPSTMRIVKESLLLLYFDGPPTKLNEGESEELTLE